MVYVFAIVGGAIGLHLANTLHSLLGLRNAGCINSCYSSIFKLSIALVRCSMGGEDVFITGTLFSFLHA